MHNLHMLRGLAAPPGDTVNGNGIVPADIVPTDSNDADAVGEDITSFFEDPAVQRGFRMAGAAFAPVGGFIWGALVGLLIGPSGGRGAAAVDAGVCGALTNFGQSLICVPDGMQGVCEYTNWVPATTLVSGYVAYQHRTGERG